MKKILFTVFGLLAFILSVVLLFAGFLFGGGFGAFLGFISWAFFVLSGLLLA